MPHFAKVRVAGSNPVVPLCMGRRDGSVVGRASSSTATRWPCPHVPARTVKGSTLSLATHPDREDGRDQHHRPAQRPVALMVPAYPGH